MSTITGYRLKAQNKEGASMTFYARTKSAVLKQFDQEYSRAGFCLTLYTDFDDFNGNTWSIDQCIRKGK